MPLARARPTWSPRESGGNPLFIDELVRHIQSGAADRTIGRRSVSSTWTRCSGRGFSGSRRTPSGCWGRWPSRAGRSARRWPSRPPSWAPDGRVALASLRSARLIRCIGQATTRRSRPTTIGSARRWLPTCRRSRVRWNHERLALVLATSGLGRPGGPRRPLPGRRGDRACAASTMCRRPTRPPGAGVRPCGAALSHRPRAARRVARARLACRGGSWVTRWPMRAGATRRPRPTRRRPRRPRRPRRSSSSGWRRRQLLLSRTYRRRARPVAHPARPAGAVDARDGPAGDAFAGLASIPAQASRAQVPAARREPDLGDGLDQDRPLLVGRGGALDVRADPGGRLPDAGALAGTSSRRAAADRAGPGDGSRTPGHGRAPAGRTGSRACSRRPNGSPNEIDRRTPAA